jgi:hypothetical protein
VRAIILKSTVFSILITVALAWGRDRVSPPLSVTYYYLPNCMACEKVRDGLAPLPSGFAGRVKLRMVPYNTDEGAAAAERYGFVTHGVVVADAQGQMLWEEKDHGVSADDVRVAVELALEGKPILATR